MWHLNSVTCMVLNFVTFKFSDIYGFKFCRRKFALFDGQHLLGKKWNVSNLALIQTYYTLLSFETSLIQFQCWKSFFSMSKRLKIFIWKYNVSCLWSVVLTEAEHQKYGTYEIIVCNSETETEHRNYMPHTLPRLWWKEILKQN